MQVALQEVKQGSMQSNCIPMQLSMKQVSVQVCKHLSTMVVEIVVVVSVVVEVVVDATGGTIKDQLKDQGLMSKVFTFVDASHLIAKENLWEERDAVIKKKYDKLNNETVAKVVKDKQAKIGCKGSNKY